MMHLQKSVKVYRMYYCVIYEECEDINDDKCNFKADTVTNILQTAVSM